MKLAESNKKIDSIIKLVEKDGIVVDTLIKELTELRELALKEGDPLVTKILRLTYESLEENEGYDVDVDMEALEIDGDEPKDLFVHFMGLLKQPENKYNRDELQIIKHAILGRPYESPYLTQEEDVEE